jgi:hypothetical protein
MCNNVSWNRAVYEIMGEEYGRTGKTTDDSRIRRMHFVWWITKATHTHTLRIYNNYCFYAAPIFTRTRLNFTLYVHCASCYLTVETQANTSEIQNTDQTFFGFHKYIYIYIYIYILYTWAELTSVSNLFFNYPKVTGEYKFLKSSLCIFLNLYGVLSLFFQKFFTTPRFHT